MNHLSRREFLGVSAVGAGTMFLTGCAGQSGGRFMVSPEDEGWPKLPTIAGDARLAARRVK